MNERTNMIQDNYLVEIISPRISKNVMFAVYELHLSLMPSQFCVHIYG